MISSDEGLAAAIVAPKPCPVIVADAPSVSVAGVMPLNVMAVAVALNVVVTPATAVDIVATVLIPAEGPTRGDGTQPALVQPLRLRRSTGVAGDGSDRDNTHDVSETAPPSSQ